MRNIAVVLTLATMTSLLAESSSSYRVTHTYTLGGDGNWDFNVLGRIPAAEDADAIIYDNASNRVFTLNGDAHSSTVIDPRAGTLITNIPLGGKPEYGASAGDGKVYANLTDTSEVVEIDAKT